MIDSQGFKAEHVTVLHEDMNDYRGSNKARQLVAVSEVDVLLVSQVEESLGEVNFVLGVLSATLHDVASLALPSVLVHVVNAKAKQHEDRSDVAPKLTAECFSVQGGIAGLEQLGTGRVSCSPTDEGHRCDNATFRLTSDVPGQKREGESGLNLDADGHVEGEEETAGVLLGVGYGQEEHCGDDVGQSPDTSSPDGLVPLLGHVRSREEDKDLHRSLSESEKVGLQDRETEVRLDDDVTVAAETTGGNGVEEVDEEEAPGLGILESFPELFELELPVLDTGLVLSDTFDELDTVFVRDTAGLHGRGGQNENDETSPEDGEKAERKEHDLPGRKRSMLNVVESEAQESSHHGLKSCSLQRKSFLSVSKLSDFIRRQVVLSSLTIAAVPESDRSSLFFLAVPNGRKSDESGLTDALEASEQDSKNENSGKVVAEGDEAKGHTPCEDTESEPTVNRQALDEVILRTLHAKNCEVETCEEPAVVLTLQMEVGFDTHDGGETEDLLVQTLAEVSAEHDGKDTLVYQSKQSLVLLGGDGDRGVGVFQHFLISLFDNNARKHGHGTMRRLAVDDAFLVHDRGIGSHRLGCGELVGSLKIGGLVLLGHGVFDVKGEEEGEVLGRVWGTFCPGMLRSIYKFETGV